MLPEILEIDGEEILKRYAILYFLVETKFMKYLKNGNDYFSYTIFKN